MADEVGKIYISVEGRDVGLSQVLAAVQQRANALIGTSTALDSAIARTTAAQSRQEQQSLRNAQVMASLQKALGDNVGAAQTFANASGRMTAGSSAQIQAQTGLVNAVNKTVAALEAEERASIRKAQAMAKAQSATGNLAGAQNTLQSALSSVNKNTQAAADAEAQLNSITAKLSQQHQAAANSALRQAMAEAKLAKSTGTGGNTQGIGILQNALQNTTASTMMQTKAQTQLNQMMSASGASTTTFASALSSLGKAALASAAAFAAMQIVDFGKDALESANKLEKVEAITKALAQTDAKYAEVLAIARSNQDKFGGSLQENMSALGKLVNISNRANVNLQQMDNISRRLAIVDPLQGYEGGVIALQEFMSGDIRSLAQRFELPRDELNAAKDAAGSYQNKLDALDQVLTKFGISQNVINSQLDTTARVYDQLGAKADNAKVSLGGLIAEMLRVPAQKLGDGLQYAANSLGSLTDLIKGNKINALTEQMFSASGSVDEYNQKIQKAKADAATKGSQQSAATSGMSTIASGLVISQLNEMNAAQFAFAQKVKATGAEWDVVIAKLDQAKGKIVEYQQTLHMAQTGGVDISNEQVDQLSASLARLSSINAFGAEQANVFASALANESMSAANAQRDVDLLTQQLLAAQQAKADATAASGVLTQAQKDEAVSAAEDSVNQEILKVKVDALSSASSLAAQQMIAAGGDMTAAGISALAAAPNVDVLTRAFLRLAAAKAEAAEGDLKSRLGASKVLPPSARVSEVGEIRNMKRENVKQTREQNAKTTREAVAAEQEYQYHVGNTTQKLAILQDQLAKTTDVAEQYAIKQKIFDLQNQKGGGGGGASPKLTAQEKLNNQLAGNQDKYYDQQENLELKHQQKILDIQEEYAKKQLEAQKQNEVNKRRSRYDFYSSLQDIPASDAQKYAAQYEEAFRKSQEMAQQGQQRLAKDYLDMRQKQIEEMKDLEGEKRDIAEDEDMSRKEKEAAIAYVEARKKMLEDAQREEEKQLLEGGDANQKELQDKLAEEDQSYADSLERTGQKADQLADRRIAAWERANKKIAETPPAELTNLSGQTPATTPTTTPAVRPPVAGADNAMPVRSADIFVVRDQGVIDSIGDQTARLEGKLDALKVSVETGLTDVANKVNDLKVRQAGMVRP